VSDGRQVEDMVKAIARFGKVDILTNVAGIGPLRQSVADVPEELWDRSDGSESQRCLLVLQGDRPHMKQRLRENH
jgi:NAD(P)-dependent dehydrogenase (short-subunit alcohol dehydrogenase family)